MRLSRLCFVYSRPAALNANTALLPPKANELDRAARTAVQALGCTTRLGK
jgi:hypothetical protein